MEKKKISLNKQWFIKETYDTYVKAKEYGTVQEQLKLLEMLYKIKNIGQEKEYQELIQLVNDIPKKDK